MKIEFPHQKLLGEITLNDRNRPVLKEYHIKNKQILKQGIKNHKKFSICFPQKTQDKTTFKYKLILSVFFYFHVI